jgi:glycerol-3-phosphate acyltransferase PlsY
MLFALIVIPVIAYLLGSIPTALIVGRHIKGVDFLKGSLSVLLALLLGLSIEWQMIVGACAILGHDFPVFAGFRGGQGTATTLGTMLILFPMQTLLGLILYGALFLITHNSRLSCGIGGGLIALLVGVSQQWILLIYAVAAFIFIPVKLFIDTPRRQAIEVAETKSSLKE